MRGFLVKASVSADHMQRRLLIYGDTLLIALIDRYAGRMDRLPHYPRHITQRGNRRQRIFLVDDDYAVYRDILAENCGMQGIEVWSYCFMPNHVHLILTPSSSDELSRRDGRSAPPRRAFRYVAMNQSNLLERPDARQWSSAPAHLAGQGDSLVKVKPFLERIENPQEFFSSAANEVLERNLASGQSIGRPLVDDDTLVVREKVMGVQLRPGKRGRRRKENPGSEQIKLVQLVRRHRKLISTNAEQVVTNNG